MKKLISTALLIAMFATLAISQNVSKTAKETGKTTKPDYKISVNTTWLSLINFGEERTNTHHYEFRLDYLITPKDKIGIKVTTWELFEPMGIPWGPNKMKIEEAFPGRLRERGIGIVYQRLLWRGLFASIEILPLKKTYLDENNKKIGNGFKLYTTYHLGYHIPIFKNRIYFEPQIQCNYWPIDTKAPQSFQVLESKWKNYFLFEPNLYIGVNF